MANTGKFDPSTHAVGVNRDLKASTVDQWPDPPVPVEGFTFGVAKMSENAPHGGEMHPDGDEVLYLVAGRARVIFLDDDADVDLRAGDGLIVPQGRWHRVDILEPCHFVYLTPGPNNRFHPPDDQA